MCDNAKAVKGPLYSKGKLFQMMKISKKLRFDFIKLAKKTFTKVTKIQQGKKYISVLFNSILFVWLIFTKTASESVYLPNKNSADTY